MLRFDTLKIAFPNLCLTTEKYKAFAAFPSSKHVDRWNYYLGNPCPGIIAIRVGDTETTIEFSAKILKVDYPQLLSIDTIRLALENIIKASPLKFDVEEVLRLAHVLKAHQKQQIALSQPFAAYVTPLTQLHVSREYRPQSYKDETLTFLQNATGKGREYFKMYYKAKEYARPANAAYRNSLTAAERKTVAACFEGEISVETEINGKVKLRQYFPDIDPRIMLTDLLQSTSNPLATQFAEITKEAYAAIDVPAAAKALAFADTLSFDDREAFSNLESHGFDLEKIDARLKALNVPKATQCRKRKKYAVLLAGYLAHTTDSPSVEALRELKAAINSPTPITIGDLVSKMEPATMVSEMEPQHIPNPAPITIGDLVSKMEPHTPAITIPIPTRNWLTSPCPASTPEQDEAFFALLDTLAHHEPAETSLW